ncbi:intermembrane transport protein PqiB [Idiomarina sp. OT37-5b]|uniref:Paraquat-inducible protein B n=1 Tax=Idiomarina aquatica TaxID=1327752 RepID=A0AA94JDS1_9GAMM|nr:MULTISPECIES: intermembrane transport protein PqiB [Idiomarina]AVJ55449.1 intermembrane transport protein PqiB [Idiomarina sp. OT37-5b]RUO44928.1 paraquat-inducible protein B [Idiomarina aquatica]
MSRSAIKNLISPIWLIPLLALAVALWMVWQESAGAGPQVQVLISDAEGLEAGKTPVRVRNVDVGLVSEISLNDDMSAAVLTIDMNENTQRMLAVDSEFWVVKPRIGRQGVSGLSTLLSGAYLRLQPGSAEQTTTRFKALEEPPVTPQQTPGRRITLTSSVNAAVVVGDSVQYRGVSVGQVEKVAFNVDNRTMEYQVFVEQPYDELLTENTRFWLQSGLSLRWNASGLDVSLGSFESLLGAGINFGVPEGQPSGEKIAESRTFELFASEEAARQQGFVNGIDYVILLDESVAGLEEGAPVQFKGVRVGTVLKVPLRWNPTDDDQAPLKQIPVLVRYEPERMDGLVPDTRIEYWRERLPELFEQGLRANIRASNLLTNTLYVDLRFYPEAEAVAEQEFAGYPVLPSMVSDFSRLEEKLNQLLDKFNGLQLEASLNEFSEAMTATQTSAEEIEALAQSVAEIVAQPGMQELPQLLQQNLVQLQQLLDSVDDGSATRRQLHRSLSNIEQLTRDLKPFIEQLREQPNSLIFAPEETADPEPKAND